MLGCPPKVSNVRSGESLKHWNDYNEFYSLRFEMPTCHLTANPSVHPDHAVFSSFISVSFALCVAFGAEIKICH